ncbi:MAG: hypothetical protein HQK85_11050, partial [Nitrospinae bacterium]|nr:hypothetical protein [Nitrospinota bacterium]
AISHEIPTSVPTYVPGQRHEDVGEKIGGARKDRWKDRGLNLADLEGMSAGEEYEYVTKYDVWPNPDYAKMVEDGMEPVAARALKLIRDSLPIRPGTDTPASRRDYVEIAGILRDLSAGVKTFKDLKEAAGRAESQIKFSKNRETSRITEIIRAVGKKPSTILFNIQHNDYLLTRELQTEIEMTGWPLAKKTAKKSDGVDDKDKKALPSRPHLDNLEMTNTDWRKGRDITGDDLLKEFGFRGVEYGNWVANDERQKVLNLAYDSMRDLADTLRIPPEAISLNGKLGLAFGARGGGKAAAHYEPHKLVINLTKLKGAGTLAHEWGHALDHYFGELDREKAGKSEYVYATGGRKQIEEHQLSRHLGNLRTETRQAFKGVMSAMYKKDKTKAEIVRDHELRLEKLGQQIETQKSDIEKAKARLEGPDAVSNKGMLSKFIKDSTAWLKDAELRKGLVQRNLDKAREGDIGVHPVTANTSYISNATTLGDYWQRPTEMFARAFEAYVFDKTTAHGGKTAYLVHSVEGDRYAGDSYKGNPYPAGMEREAINKAFEKLFETIKVKTNAATGKPSILYSMPKGGRNVEVKIVKIAGDEIGSANTPIKELQRMAHRYARENLQGKKVSNAATGWEIAISRDGLDKGMSHAAKKEQNQAIFALPELLHEAVLAQTEAPRDTKNKHVRWYHTFYAPLQIGEILHRVKLTVKETNMGHKFYDHSLTEIEKPVRNGQSLPSTNEARPKSTGSKIEPSFPGASAHKPRQGNSISTVSIRDLLANVKNDIKNAESPESRRTAGVSPGLGIPVVNKIVDNFRRSFPGVSDVYIHVVGSVKDLPYTAHPNVEAAVINGEVYLVAGNLPNFTRAREVLFHEMVGHVGIARMMGDKFTPLVEEVSRQFDAEMQLVARDYGYNLNDPQQRMIAAEEVIARKAETDPDVGIVKRFIARVRLWLRQAGFHIKLTDNDILALLTEAKRRMERSGQLGMMAQDGTRESAAWHGTPHTLEPEDGHPLGKFTTRKIGTGERTKNEGCGLYFTSKRRIAQ